MAPSSTGIFYFGPAGGAEDLNQILVLQQSNLPENLDREEILSQGFVTVRHDFALLQAMNAAAPHIVAKYHDQVVGYALTMLPSFADRVPILDHMFDRINTLSWKGRPLVDWRYYAMGQVCVAKSFRGQGVFDGLYEGHRRYLSPAFEAVITEVSTRNTRSLRAHERVGFETLEVYRAPDGQEWALIGLELR